VFSRLQAAMDEGRTDQLLFFAFDLLFLNGQSTALLPLIKRKERLKGLFKKEIQGLRYNERARTSPQDRWCGSFPIRSRRQPAFGVGLPSAPGNQCQVCITFTPPPPIKGHRLSTIRWELIRCRSWYQAHRFLNQTNASRNLGLV
jgi:hypothetical protein